MTDAGPVARQSPKPYVLAGAMLAAAVVIVAVLAVIVLRAISGYSIALVEPGEPAQVTLGEHDVAIWSSPETDRSDCTAIDASGQNATRANMTASLTLTDGGLTWHRLTTIHGSPGTYTLTCESDSDVVFGYGPSPRIGHYLLMGVVGGGAAAVLTLASFMIFLLTILRRRNRRPATA